MKIEKPEEAPSGFMQELPQASGSSKQYFFPTAPSGCLQGRRHARRCYFYSSNVDGASFDFAFAEAAGEARPIAVMPAAARQGSKDIARRNENIVKPKKGKRRIAKLKIAAGTVTIETNQKTWMMRLQHPGVHGL
jgi:hypothetical protein